MADGLEALVRLVKVLAVSGVHAKAGECEEDLLCHPLHTQMLLRHMHNQELASPQ